MKWFVLVMAMWLSGCSTTSHAVTENTYIQVISKGATPKEAKENGFRIAIEEAVGTLVVTDATIKNNKLVRNEINAHSAGYIDSFYIISETKTESGEYLLLMGVRVKVSQLHKRILGSGTTTNNLNGQVLYQQYRTYNNSKDDALKIVNLVLDEFPKKAFDVSNPTVRCLNNVASKFCFTLDNRGMGILEIPYLVTWNYGFIQALNESLANISDPGSQGEKFIIISKSPGSIIGSTNKHNFNDVSVLRKIKNRFLGTVYVHANVVNSNGETLHSSCTSVYTIPHVDFKDFVVRGNEFEEGTLQIKIDRNNRLEEATEVKLHVSKTRC